MDEPARIEVLSDIEAVRRRPGMFVGDPRDGTGLAHLVWEVLANVLDQHLRGEAHKVRIELFGDGIIEVEDDGAGISQDKNQNGVPLLELMLVTLYRGPTFDGHLPHVHLGLDNQGLGLTPVSALCSFFEIETTCRGERARVRTERGIVTETAHSLGASARRGTLVRFRPDETIFSFALTPALLAPRLEEIAWMHPLLAITWQGKEIASRGGFGEWTRTRALGGLDDDFVFAARTLLGENFVDLAFGWERDDTRPHSDHPALLSFVNSNRTGRGTHVRGLLEGLSAVALAYGLEASSEAFSSRLVGFVHVTLRDPSFANPTRDVLTTPLAKELVSEVVQAQLPAAFECHPLAKARFIARATRAASAL